MHGTLTGYRLIYGVRGDDVAEQRQFDADKQHFTTPFLGTLLCLCFNGHFSRWNTVKRHRNVSVLDFTGAKDDGGGEW